MGLIAVAFGLFDVFACLTVCFCVCGFCVPGIFVREATCGKPAEFRITDVWRGSVRVQTFVPDVGAYDMVWLNWSLMYLLDADIVTALTRAAEALRPGGFVVVKENMLPLPGAFRVDTAEGFNFFKSREYWRALWERAGLTEVTSRRSEPWPEDWIPVDMIALRLLAHTREFVVTNS